MAKKQKYNPHWRKEWFKALRLLTLEKYGGKCLWCGIDDPDVLTLDHINDDGKEHRLAGLWSEKLYIYLRDKKWPKGQFQVLCRNCNWKKEVNRKNLAFAAKHGRWNQNG